MLVRTAECVAATKRQSPARLIDRRPVENTATPLTNFASDDATQRSDANNKATKICAICKKSCRSLRHHIIAKHPEVDRRRLMGDADTAVAAMIESTWEQSVAHEKVLLQQQFLLKFKALEKLIQDNSGTVSELEWEEFERIYTDFVALLLRLQPQFYRRTGGAKKRQKRRSVEEVEHAREAFRYKEAQHLFHEEPKKLRRKIFGATPDKAEFNSAELFSHFHQVF